MQGAHGYWLREQRAALARKERPKRVAEHRVISEIWPDAVLPRPETHQTPQAPRQRQDLPPGPVANGGHTPVPKDPADLLRFAQSERFQRLRQEVVNNPKALESFLEEVTSEQPELMRLITHYQQDFLRLLTADLVESKENQAPREEVPEPVKPSAKLKAKKKILQSLQPKTNSCHTIVNMHSPFSCAVCKSTKELMLCSACQSVRFCSRECQRQFWPRHQSVCRFVSSIKGGLLQQVAGRRWVQEALPEVVEVWTKSRGQAPASWELEQLIHLPHCRVCSKAPATFLCPACQQVAYCSEDCRELDDDHEGSWPCLQLSATAIAASVLHKASVHFQTGLAEGPDPDAIFQEGWQEFVTYTKLRGMDGRSFEDLPITAKQIIIDSLSFPMSVVEACRLHDYHWLQPHVKVHILNAYGSTMADLHKYEEWLHRWANVTSLELHFVVPEGQVNKEESCELELCESCRQLKRRLTCILHETSLLNFLTKEEKPFLRVAFSPALGRFPLGDPADPWEPALRRLVDLDDVPLVITERTTADIGAATERLEELGFENIVLPRNSNFPSPLTLLDAVRDEEENPIGLTIWNMSIATFQAKGGKAKPRPLESGQDVKTLSGTEISVPEDCRIGDRVVVRRHLEGEVSGLRSGGYPNGVEVTLLDGSRKHFLPSELELISRAAEATDHQAPRLELKLHYAGPWRASYEDVDFTREANPESFVVSLTACPSSASGKGFRSPLASRDDHPPSGYVFYVDGDDRWAFWVGDGHYWSGVQGPTVECRPTELKGSYDATTRCVSLYVDGQLVGQRLGVDFVANTRRPLRIGAGRSENPTLRYFFDGDVSNIKIFQILPE